MKKILMNLITLSTLVACMPTICMQTNQETINESLFDAIDNLDYSAVKTALSNGAQVNSINPQGITSLETIINFRVFMRGFDHSNSNAMHSNGKKLNALAQLLINNKNFDINHQNKELKTILHLASQYDMHLIVQKLLENPKIDIDLKNGDNLTALALAKKYEHETIVQQILIHTFKRDLAKKLESENKPLKYKIFFKFKNNLI